MLLADGGLKTIKYKFILISLSFQINADTNVDTIKSEKKQHYPIEAQNAWVQFWPSALMLQSACLQVVKIDYYSCLPKLGLALKSCSIISLYSSSTHEYMFFYVTHIDPPLLPLNPRPPCGVPDNTVERYSQPREIQNVFVCCGFPFRKHKPSRTD